MRLKAEIWVKAYLRLLNGEGVPAVIVRRGDEAAGAIFIKISTLDGRAALFGPAPAGVTTQDGERRWIRQHKAQLIPDSDIEATLRREREFDPDLWIVEVEDRQGRHFLGDWLIAG